MWLKMPTFDCRSVEYELQAVHQEAAVGFVVTQVQKRLILDRRRVRLSHSGLCCARSVSRTG